MMKKFSCVLLALLMLLSLSPIAAATTDTETARTAQGVTSVLDAVMAQMAVMVPDPTFGTNAGEWTVFSLARGNYFPKGHKYFTDYYARIEETVKTIAADVDMDGALHKNKSTENSRLIVALSAIGKDATSVGGWDLVEAYSANGIHWIKKQGINGTIWTLIALDSGNYETSDATIRQQCVDSIVSLQHNDGGWSLIVNKNMTSNVDITCMTLTALYPYRNQPAVAAACEKAIEWLSEVQLATGGFPYGVGETSESCAWAIVALTAWGINLDTDPRFIKNGISAVDNLLTYYVEADKMFAHQGSVSNNMATDQACYALVAYDRFLNGQNALYDMSDSMQPDNTEPPKVEDTDPPKVEDTDPPKVEDTDPPKVEDTDPPKVEDTDPPKVEDTDPPKVEDTDSPKVEDTDPPKVEDTDPPKVEDNDSPEVEVIDPPKTEDNDSPEVEVIDPPKTEDNETPVVENNTPSTDENSEQTNTEQNTHAKEKNYLPMVIGAIAVVLCGAGLAVWILVKKGKLLHKK